jgi:hypothetical protein|tara:strand:- start:1024 stop:1347 length:324 start_codon:yes stop_codon:yes gene_type:complete
MSNYHRKIMHLHPTAILEEDFLLRNNTIKHWNDAKLGPKPTLAQIDAQVSDVGADVTWQNKEQDGKFNKDIVKAIGLTMKEFMNEIMAGRTTPITNSELKTKFKSHL